MKALWTIARLWRGQAIWLLLGGVVSVAGLAAGLALLETSGATLAVALTGGGLLLPVGLRALGGLRTVLRYAERMVTHDATFRALADVRVWFFRGLAARAAGGLAFRRAGDLLSRLVGDVEALDGLYLRILVPLAGALLLLPVLGVAVWRLDPVAAAAVVGVFALECVALPMVAGRWSARESRVLAQASAALRIASVELFSGLREVRAFGAEGRMMATLQAREAALIRLQGEVATRTAIAVAAAFMLGQIAVIILVAASAESPALGLGLVFLSVAGFDAISALPTAGVLAGYTATAAERVIETASGPMPVIDPAHPAALPSGTALSFHAVRFRWSSDRPPALDGLTIEIPPGARVAILGPSGSGKSTLAALALKVAAPESGQVRLGGVDLARLTADAVRTRIAWLGQATHLFDDTVRANLLMGRPDATEAELWAALDQAAVGGTVRGWPDELDTWLGEAGARVSGGQGRRIALARVLLSKAPILILDEPAAGLDAETERAFLTTLNDVAQDRTVILIAHRLTGVERLDRIYRLSAGVAVAAAA